MGRLKDAYFSGKLQKPRTKPRRPAKPGKAASNPFQKPSFRKRGTWKDTPADRKGVLRKAKTYGQWLGWREGHNGARARFRPPAEGGSLENARDLQFNIGYAQGYNAGRQARKSIFRRKQRGPKPQRTTKPQNTARARFAGK